MMCIGTWQAMMVAFSMIFVAAGIVLGNAVGLRQRHKALRVRGDLIEQLRLQVVALPS